MPFPFKFKQADDGSIDCYDALNRSGLSIRGIIDHIVKYHKEQAEAATDANQKKKLEHQAAEWVSFAEVMAAAKNKDEFIKNSAELLPRLTESFIVWSLYN